MVERQVKNEMERRTSGQNGEEEEERVLGDLDGRAHECEGDCGGSLVPRLKEIAEFGVIDRCKFSAIHCISAETAVTVPLKGLFLSFLELH